MDAIKFLKEKKRMCDMYSRSSCCKCPLFNKNECLFESSNHCKYIVESVEKWAQEHNEVAIFSKGR